MALSLALPFSMSLGLLGLPMAQYGNFRSFLGGSGTPKCHFWGAKRFQTDPPRCEVQCSTLFNQCSTHLWSLGLPMANYGHIWPKRVILGGFWGPPVPFLGGKKGPNWPPQMWSIMFNLVQPMFIPFGVARTAYGQIWPYLAEKCHKMAIKYGKWCPSRLNIS